MTHSAVVNKIDTVPQARELALSLSTKFWYATQPVFSESKVVGFFVRLEKRQNGVGVETKFLHGEDAQDFVKAVKAGSDVQGLIGAWY